MSIEFNTLAYDYITQHPIRAIRVFPECENLMQLSQLSLYNAIRNFIYVNFQIFYKYLLKPKPQQALRIS